MKKATEAQLDAQAALKRATKAARTAKEIRKSNCKLLKSFMNLERQILVHALEGCNRDRCLRRDGHGDKDN